MHPHAAVYGRILRHLRESKGRGQAEVVNTMGISPAQLARLEANQRGLYVEDFVRIAEALGGSSRRSAGEEIERLGSMTSSPQGQQAWRIQ